MPFMKLSDKTISVSGFLDGEMQFFDSVVISDELLKNMFEVNPGKFGIGSCIYSDSFGSCIAVCAKLKDNRFALFHATDAFDSSALTNFINEISGKVNEIFVFEKKSGKHAKTVPFLILTILGKLEIEPIRIPIDKYRAVIVDSTNNRIILTNKILSNEKYYLMNEESKGYIIDRTTATPLIETIKGIDPKELQNKSEFFTFPQQMVKSILKKDTKFKETEIRSPEKKSQQPLVDERTNTYFMFGSHKKTKNKEFKFNLTEDGVVKLTSFKKKT